MPRTTTKKPQKAQCMLCGRQLPVDQFGITQGLTTPGLPIVCLDCTHALLSAADASRVPEVMDHFVEVASRTTEVDDFHFLDEPDFSKPSKKKNAGAPALPLTMESLGTPREIYDYLGQYCYGQEEARKALAVAVHNHYKRLLNERNKGDLFAASDVELSKSNVLMLGPSGSGKTLLAQALAKRLQVPFAISDATTLTEAGYVGEDVENILLRLVQAADFDLEKASMGIVYVDEIDKIARKTQNVSVTRDVSGEGVQQALLKIVEGTVANIPPKGGRKHPDQEYLHLDTRNILFICGGAFVGLDKIVARRGGSRQLGFGESGSEDKAVENAVDIAKNPLQHVEPEDLVQFGLIPELVGRLPVIAALNELSSDDLVHILTEPKNSIVKQYQQLMRISGVELEFTAGALKAVAEQATALHTGARGLRAIIEKRMLDVMFDLPKLAEGQKGTCVIDEKVIRGEKAAVVKIG